MVTFTCKLICELLLYNVRLERIDLKKYWIRCQNYFYDGPTKERYSCFLPPGA